VRTLIVFLALSSAAAAQVTGTIQYQDRTYTSGGFTGVAPRPVRQAEIEIVRASDNFVFSSGATGDDGSFSLSGVPAGEVVRFRLYARRTAPQLNIVVRNNPTANLLYAVASGTLDTSVSTSFGTVTLSIASGSAQVFNIFDCAVKSFEYMLFLDPATTNVPLMLVYWEPGTQNGTYFDRAPNAIFLLGDPADPDEFDDDIILHEMGHWVAFNYSKDDTLGDRHAVYEQLDPRTSWSEGFAHYWSAAVRRHENFRLSTLPGPPPPEYAAPNLQVDNKGIGNGVFDIEGPSFPTQAVMATNELAVACVLWDITDVVNESPFDTLSGNEPEIWRVLHNRIPTRANITLEDFHAGLELEAPAIMAAVTGDEVNPGIFKDRLIRYYPDSNESNDSAGAAIPLPLGAAGLLQRTFFRPAVTHDGDEDWYTVDATVGTLVVETLNLGDGADTLLQLYDATGSVLLDSNDNRTPGDRSSLIARVIAAPTTFLVRVRASGVAVQYGYYDLRAQVVVNGPPIITSVSASATSGSAPLRVTFSGSISDSDGGAHEFQWDFNGDGIADWSSLEGPGATTTYDEPGTYISTLRVLDSGDSLVTVPITITVQPSAAPTIALSASPSLGSAPFTVSFNATVTGVVPAAYLWDFDGDGVIDHVSVTSPAATFVFRSGGVFFPRLLVRDNQGRGTRAVGPSVSVAAGASPPTISSFVAGSGFLPYSSTFTIAHSDLGPLGTVELDLEGDKQYDLIAPPGSSTGSTFSVPIQCFGTLLPRVRVTDSAGRSVTASTSYSSRVLGAAGWMVDPRQGDRLSGTGLTLTAQAVPEGVLKSVQFQRRDALGGPWINIGAPILSTRTLFSTRWDVSGLPDLSSFDLRILIDGTVSSGDTSSTIVIDRNAPTITENGTARTKTVRTDRTTVSRNAQGVWVIVPLGATADALPLRLEPATAPMASGSALTMVPRGGAWRVDFAGSFSNAFQIRLPISGDGVEDLEIHHVDESSGLWQRLAYPRVSPSDAWVEAAVNAPGVYAVFAPGGSGGGNHGGGCGATGLEAAALLGMVSLLRRRRC
jgi:PKD repeat protein